MLPELAYRLRGWHGGAMEDGRNLSRSGGCLLAFSVVAGVFVGTILGQPSIGFLAGSALGLMLVIAVFLLDRR
jgi:hypothetical protein